jgi:hypothetical protein
MAGDLGIVGAIHECQRAARHASLRDSRMGPTVLRSRWQVMGHRLRDLRVLKDGSSCIPAGPLLRDEFVSRPCGTLAGFTALTQHRVRRENRFVEDRGIFSAPNPVLGYFHASLRDSRMGPTVYVPNGKVIGSCLPNLAPAFPWVRRAYLTAFFSTFSTGRDFSLRTGRRAPSRN